MKEPTCANCARFVPAIVPYGFTFAAGYCRALGYQMPINGHCKKFKERQ